MTAPALRLKPQTVQASVKVQALQILWPGLISEVIVDFMMMLWLKSLALAGAW